MAESWSWSVEDVYDPVYTATAAPAGIAYMVYMGGPSGGDGMAGFQTHDDFLREGGINEMPPEIAAKVREAL